MNSYDEAELYKAAVRLYTRPLFDARKALSTSNDEQTLFDFARHGLHKIDRIHRQLSDQSYAILPLLALRRCFNGRERTLYIGCWEDRLINVLLYRMLNKKLQDYFSPSAYAYRCGGFGVDRCQRRIAQQLRTGCSPCYVVKRDISDYFATINHDILMSKIAELISPGDYLYSLLDQCVRFRSVQDNCENRATIGVAFGTASACVLANIYLTTLDYAINALPNVRYYRYADDIIAICPNRESADHVSSLIKKHLDLLKLKSNPKHEATFLFGNSSEVDVESRDRFRHLGLEYRCDGSIGLSRDKFRKLRNLFRYGFRRHRRRFRKLSTAQSRVQLAISIAHKTINTGIRNVAIIDYYLRHISDETQLRQLDRWLAEEVLAIGFQRGHKKSNFRLMSFKELRERGLPSLRHRHRMLKHGHIQSSFFVWKSNRLQSGRSGLLNSG